MLEVLEKSNVAIIKVAKTIDDAAIKSTVMQLLNEGRTRILFDLQDLDFVDSSGLGVLVNAFKLVKASKGSLSFFNAQPFVQKLIELTKLNRVLEVYPNEQAALSAITG